MSTRRSWQRWRGASGSWWWDSRSGSGSTTGARRNRAAAPYATSAGGLELDERHGRHREAERQLDGACLRGDLARGLQALEDIRGVQLGPLDLVRPVGVVAHRVPARHEVRVRLVEPTVTQAVRSVAEAGDAQRRLPV